MVYLLANVGNNARKTFIYLSIYLFLFNTVIQRKYFIFCLFLAAHCCKVDGENTNIFPNLMLASLGRYRLRDWREEGSINEDIKNYILHPDYTHQRSGDSDLAILVLKNSVEFSPRIRPICLWPSSSTLQDVLGKFGYVVGWGRDESGQPHLAEPRMARLPVIKQVKIYS